MKKKPAWEKLLGRMNEAMELAETVCMEQRSGCEHCPLYVEAKDEDCAKGAIRDGLSVLKGYDKKETMRAYAVYKNAQREGNGRYEIRIQSHPKR